jgi:hypothetical protein
MGVWVSIPISSEGGQEAGVSTLLLNNRVRGGVEDGGVCGKTMPNWSIKGRVLTVVAVVGMGLLH